MNIESTVPMEFARDLGYLGADDVPHLMACIVGLGAEVFMLKAELERLRRTLEASGGLKADALEAMGSDPAFAQWLQQESDAFGRSLLGSFLQSIKSRSQAGSESNARR